MLTTKIKAIIAVGVLAAAFWSGWAVNDYRWQAKYSKLGADHKAELFRINNEYVADVAVMAEAADTLRAEIAAKDTHYQEIVDHARTQQDDLRRAIRDGERRLFITTRNAQDVDKATMPTATKDPGMDDGQARAELDPAAAERIIRIVNDGDDAIRQLTALQEVCSITTASNPLTQ